MSNKINSDNVIVRMKQAMAPDFLIASKLGWTEAQVKERWALLQEQAKKEMGNGYDELIGAWTVHCSIFQNMGYSLRQLAEGLSNEASPDEVNKIIGDDSRTGELMRSFIILKKFVPRTPEEMLKDDLARQ
jgi:hypothetical protein